jgi:rubrerythrin
MGEPAAKKYSFRELSSLDRLDVDALRSLYTIELSGEAFYLGLAARVPNADAAALLRRNGREEAGHARRARRAISLLLGTDFEPTPDMLEPGAVPLPDAVDAAMLSVLMQGELDGDATYQRWAAHEPDPAVAQLLQRNGREEAIHAGRVERAIALLPPG